MSIMKRYLLSYMTVGLAACAIIGLSFNRIAVSVITDQYKELQCSKLTAVVEDLCAQEELLCGIVYSIQGSSCYHPSIMKRTPLSAKDMLKDMAKYRGYSQLADEFFMAYRDSEYIYYPEAMTYSYVYLSKFRELSDVNAVADWLGALETPGIWKEDGLLLWAYPVRTLFGVTNDAALCFVVPEEKLHARMAQVAGKLDGELDVDWNGIALLKDIPLDTMHQIEQEAEGFRVRYAYHQGNYAMLTRFSNFTLLALVVSVAMVVVMAGAAARRSYHPIRQVVQKYSPEGFEGDELQMLDELIREQTQEVEIGRSRLELQMRETERQRAVLRWQWMYLNLNSGTRIREMGEEAEPATFMHEYFLLCAFSLSEGEIETLRRRMEALSDDESDYYIYGHKGLDGYIFAANFVRRKQAAPCREQLEIQAGQSGCSVQILSEEFCSKSDPLGERLKRLIASARQASAPERAVEELRDERIPDREEVVHYIHDNAFDPGLTQALVAERFCISERTVLAIVKKQTGVSYIEYLTNLRIERAKHLLREEKLSVAETCESVCYVSVPYFIKTFKSIVGVTPAKYKKQNDWSLDE